MPGMDFGPVADYCDKLDVPYTRIAVPVYDIVFNERKEKNPCSLCAKLRRGSLHTALTERGWPSMGQVFFTTGSASLDAMRRMSGGGVQQPQRAEAQRAVHCRERCGGRCT